MQACARSSRASVEQCRKLLREFPRSDVLPRPKMRTEKGEFVYRDYAWAEALRRSLPENAEGASSCAEGIDLARGSVPAKSAGVGGLDSASASLAHARKKHGRDDELFSDTDFLAHLDLKACMSSLDVATATYCHILSSTASMSSTCRRRRQGPGREGSGGCVYV